MSASSKPSSMVREAISYRKLFVFSLPNISAGYMFCLVNLYVLKYATDVLLIAPAVMGLIFGLSRFWDAVTDPLVGYLSDKTKTRWGRRRPWVLASAVPIALSFWMLNAPPVSLSEAELIAWMAAGIFLFFTAMTIFVVPQMSWGAELTPDYHERNKIYGFRHAAWIGGYTLALITMSLLLKAEQEGAATARAISEQQSLYAGGLMIICAIICVAFLTERSEAMEKRPRQSWQAVKDIWQNQHARLIIIANFLETIGIATITIVTVYFATYVMDNPTAAPLYILCFMIPSFAVTPIWIPIARHINKKHLWMGAMITTAFAYLGMGFAQPGFWGDVIVCSMAFIAGAANSCGSTVSPSLKADIIDYDEYMTGERKEGAYFAAWYFVQKSAYGIMLSMVGFALAIAGFVPNQPQNDEVVWTLRGLYALIPFVTYLFGAYLLARFQLNEQEHKDIQNKLQARKQQAASS